jgi:CRP/FNR family transcriptional regulator, cyclic AMP receptor protein
MSRVTLSHGSPNGNGAERQAIAVFDHAPELLRGVSRETAGELARLRVPSLRFDAGPWTEPPERHGCHFGFLIVAGVMARRVTFDRRTAAELLGPGDVIRPWVPQLPVDTVIAQARWQVLETVEFAVLDTEFARRVARWPQIAAALLERSTERVRMLAFLQVASHIPGLEARLLAILWAIADRWGRVTTDGVLVPVPLTHATLSELVGASRPSVSTVLKALERKRVLARHKQGWLLRDRPPSALGLDPAPNEDPPARRGSRPGHRSQMTHRGGTVAAAV